MMVVVQNWRCSACKQRHVLKAVGNPIDSNSVVLTGYCKNCRGWRELELALDSAHVQTYVSK